MTVSFWQRATLGPAISCDVAIVGGGIIGTSAAYWMKKMKPEWNVVLLESRTIGFGASGRNAGFLLQGTASNYATDIATYGEHTARKLWEFTLENRQLIEAEFPATRINLQTKGSLIAAGSEQESQKLQRSAELLNQAGYLVEFWNEEKVAKEINGAQFHGALYVPSGGSMNPIKLLSEISGTSGALILEQHPVTNISSRNDSCVLRTPRREIHANRVFLALNAYLPELLPETAPHLHPVRAQMCATSPMASWLKYPLYSHDGYYYIRQAPDGSLLLGGARHLFRNEEVGYADTTTPHLQQALLDYFNRHFFTHHNSEKPPLSINAQWSGTMALTENGLPLLAEIHEYPGSFWAAGFNGHGMGYGFRFGKMVAHLYTSSNSDVDYRSLFDIKH